MGVTIKPTWGYKFGPEHLAQEAEKTLSPTKPINGHTVRFVKENIGGEKNTDFTTWQEKLKEYDTTTGIEIRNSYTC